MIHLTHHVILYILKNSSHIKHSNLQRKEEAQIPNYKLIPVKDLLQDKMEDVHIAGQRSPFLITMDGAKQTTTICTSKARHFLQKLERLIKRIILGKHIKKRHLYILMCFCLDL